MAERRSEKDPLTGFLPPEPPGLRCRCWWIFLLAIAVYLIPSPIGRGHFILTKSDAYSWNDQARIATVESLAERGTMAIDYSKWGWFTGDKVLLREHFYSTKPPLLSAIGAVSYMAFRWVVKLFTHHEITYMKNEDIIYPWVTLTTSVVGLALLLVYFCRALHLIDIPSGARWWLFWALAIGSLYPAYSTVFNNHTVAGTGVFFAFYYVLRYRLGGPLRWWEALLAGIAAGFAGVTDITGALPLMVFFLLLLMVKDFPQVRLWRSRATQRGFLALSLALALSIGSVLALGIGTRGIAILVIAPVVIGLAVGAVLAGAGKPSSLLYLLGVLAPVIAHLFLNSRVTGNWMPTYIQSDVYIAVPPGYFGEVLSPDEAGALMWARWKYVGTALFGIRGIFIYTPVLLIGLASATIMCFQRLCRLRLEAIALVVSVVAGWGWVLFFGSPNYGGTSYGFRYALAATPMLIFFSYGIFADWNKPWLQALLRNFVVWGAIVGLIAIPYPWGMGAMLPSTQCSIVGNLENIGLNALIEISKLTGG